jgi:hypothetical protein
METGTKMASEAAVTASKAEGVVLGKSTVLLCRKRPGCASAFSDTGCEQ